MSGYVSNVPLSNQSLGQTQPIINTNFTVLNTNFGVDHVDFTNSPPISGGNGGRHNTVTLVQQAASPTSVTTAPILFCKSTTSNTLNNDIYFVASANDGGASVQLTTTKITPTASGNGVSFLPGGVIINWGTYVISSGSSSKAVTFASAFPNNVYCLVITPQGPVSFNNSLTFNYTLLTKSGFTGNRLSSVAENTTYSYIAMGN